jgi:hypothetical protein
MRHTGDMAVPKTKARFIEPMLLLSADKLPEGSGWIMN